MAEIVSTQLDLKSDSDFITTEVKVDYQLEFSSDEIARNETFELRIELIGHDFMGDPQSEDRPESIFADLFINAERPPAIVAFNFPLEVEIDIGRWPGVRGPLLIHQDYLLVEATDQLVNGSETRSFLTSVFQEEDPGTHTRVIRTTPPIRLPGQPNNDEIKARVGLTAFRRVERISNARNVEQLQVPNTDELDNDPEVAP